MKVANAVAEILKREGVEFLIGYPVNPIIEAAAEADIRTIIVRQERIGLHMADAISRVTSGERIGVFAMQHGPGTENAFGGVAQAYGDSCPIVVLPAGYARDINQVRPNFNAFLNFQHVTKSDRAGDRRRVPSPDALRRAFTQAKQRPRRRRRWSRFPADCCARRSPEPLDYQPSPRAQLGARSRPVSTRRRGARGGAASGHLSPARVCITRKAWDAVAGVGRIARSAGHDQPAGQERLSREPSAVARARAGSAMPKPVCIPSCRRPI